MKFVHLTTAKNIPRIRRNGIRKGSGRRGKGVYCMPFISADQQYECWEQGYRKIPASNRTSLKLWKPILARKYRDMKIAAIVFECSQNIYPASAFLEIENVQKRQVLGQISKVDGVINASALQAQAKQSIAVTYIEDSEIQVSNKYAMKKVLSTFIEHNGGLLVSHAEQIEIVFRNHVNQKQLRKVVPFYKTGRQFKSEC